MPPPASGAALALGRLAILVTLGSWVAYVVEVAVGQVQADALSVRSILESLAYLLLVTFLALSAVAYLITRQGYLRRTRSHARTPRAELEHFFEEHPRSITVVVPSYREEPEVILQTLLSAALQEFADLRVVLLVDDPPHPTDPEHRRLLEVARSTPARISEGLAGPCARFTGSLAAARAEARTRTTATIDAVAATADDFEFAVRWLEDVASSWVRRDHSDDFFVEHVLLALANDLSITAAALRGAVGDQSTMSTARVVELRRRLVSIFSADVSSFERKQYLNLSHEPNKAMNLNAYLGLLGQRHQEQWTTAGTLLRRCADDDPAATLVVPRPDFVVTLDADSVLLPEYCLRLVHVMEQHGNGCIGVLQTPYSAIPGAPTRVERLAGATTDLQHLVHQGMAEHDAAFWVGANAVLRTTALEDLRVDDDSDGYRVSRFISDRTVIEDTESTLDLTAKGWDVENYPERLAYSATPPDFGALCIQRQRWANGGLVILGKLRTHWRAQKERGEKRSLVELLLRLNYLGSIAWSTAGLVLLLAYPFDARLMSLLVVAISAPYFLVMSGDLKRCGHKRSDVLRIYGFNLIMLPVNASGVLRSIGQLVSGHKAAFARTPKVGHRTVAPALFVLFPYLIAALSAFALLRDVQHHHWPHAVFAAANLAITVPAILAIIGLWHSVVDLSIGFAGAVTKPARAQGTTTQLDPVLDWQTVLYHGSTDAPRGPHRHDAVTLALPPGAAEAPGTRAPAPDPHATAVVDLRDGVASYGEVRA